MLNDTRVYDLEERRWLDMYIAPPIPPGTDPSWHFGITYTASVQVGDELFCFGGADR